MHPYPLVVLILGGMGLCIGLEVLGLYVYTRRRLYGWLGLLGALVGMYCYFCFRLYSAKSLADGAYWQFRQLVTVSVMVDVTILLGLEYLGVLARRHYVALGVFTLLTAGPMWIPDVGLTHKPAVKTIEWLGVRYLEMELGPSPSAFYVVGTIWMGYIAVKLVRRSLGGSRRDRIVTWAYLFWWAAAANDMLVSSGAYPSIYLIEFAFLLIVVGVAWLVFGAEHLRGQEAERQRRMLVLEVMSKDRDLARAQAELTETAKLAAVGQLAAGVAHEVNNPLVYVMGNLELLEKDFTEQPEHLQRVRDALEGAERIRRVVRQLSTFSRRNTGSESGQVMVAVDSASKMAMVQLKDRARLEIRVPTLPRVHMDEAQLAQVLLNLLVNAAHSIPVGKRDANLVVLEARVTGASVEIAVQDSGCGIPKDVLPRIFEPFFTTKGVDEGQGLGLAISRQLVQGAGGRLTAENVLPHGARFVLSLPIHAGSGPTSQARALPVGHSTAPDPWDAQRLRVLIIDDDRDVLQALKRTLQPCFEVKTVENGQDALDLLQAQDVCELVLCDLMMPDGSGLDVVRGIAKQCPKLLGRVILMTGAASGLDQTQVCGERSYPLLCKPFGRSEFQKVVRKLWNAPLAND